MSAAESTGVEREVSAFEIRAIGENGLPVVTELTDELIDTWAECSERILPHVRMVANKG